jgi:transcriptional regulator
MRGEAIKGHLDLLLLSVLADTPLHGYAVIEELRDRSKDVFDLPEGTVYPALHRLERERLIKSKWESGANARKRRLYSLTSGGRRQLTKRRAEWSGFANAVASVVGDPS